MSEIELLDNDDIAPRYAYNSESKKHEREKYDIRAMQLIHDCLTEIALNSQNIKAAKDVKEIAGTLEVLTRTAYRILDIPPAKEDGTQKGNENLDKLINLLEEEVNK